MLNQTVFYLVDPHERPPYGRVADNLWGTEANIDSDGDSRTPDDTQWTELSLILRDGVDEAQIHIDPISDRPLILKIRSFDADLVERTARFLSEYTKGKIELIEPNLRF
ncbi:MULTISPECIES: hypothetical protein [Pseudomonas]|uniref:Uncharacterized protein n=1 Tax=Pseudomonas mosselii TaxID=78327 RepID=A0A5R8Z051_9PSED|nr:hypothetical protein [Pseudomonas mosselii]TLP59182.1 hypothetical protein FEM01_14905 [Pseudomonas mosselii]